MIFGQSIVSSLGAHISVESNDIADVSSTAYLQLKDHVANMTPEVERLISKMNALLHRLRGTGDGPIRVKFVKTRYLQTPMNLIKAISQCSGNGDRLEARVCIYLEDVLNYNSAVYQLQEHVMVLKELIDTEYVAKQLEYLKTALSSIPEHATGEEREHLERQVASFGGKYVSLCTHAICSSKRLMSGIRINN